MPCLSFQIFSYMMKNLITLVLLTALPFVVGFYWQTPGSADRSFDDSLPFNPEHLDGAFTGGFGEQTCHSCHFDNDLNMEGGSLTLQGVEEKYRAGKEYVITVTVESEHLEIGGFQMTARFEDGSQAGSFEWEGDRLMFTPAVSNDIKYLQHSADGTDPTGEREVRWTFTWLAPEDEREVIFNIAANAGNNDDSAFGDWIYVKEIVIKPGE
ncbi:hypothetical protein BH23BAC3_BH23BAC3_31670 [soil metagenome]